MFAISDPIGCERHMGLLPGGERCPPHVVMRAGDHIRRVIYTAECICCQRMSQSFLPNGNRISQNVFNKASSLTVFGGSSALNSWSIDWLRIQNPKGPCKRSFLLLHSSESFSVG